MQLLWSSASWRDEVEAWVRERVDAAGHRVDGDIQQVRTRPWSTQLTVPTTAGLLWFKENHPGQAAEAAVIDELSRITPDHVVAPLAVERTRGWLLSPDHGATLATLDATDEATWCRVLVEFADLQRRASSHREAFEAAGLAPLLPGSAADYIEEQLDRLQQLPAADLASVRHELAGHVLAAAPSIRATADRLAAAAPPLTSIDHNDLHHNNVFVPRPDETSLRFFDFGDAVWAHPFSSLGVPLRVLCEEWATTPDDSRVRRVLDSYLEVWSDVAPLADLREAARLACRLSPLHRLESWRRLLTGSRRDETDEVAGTLEYWWARVAEITPD